MKSYIDASNTVLVNQTELRVYSTLQHLGGTTTIQEVSDKAEMSFVATHTALTNLKYKGLLTSTRKRGEIPATFTLIKGRTITSFFESSTGASTRQANDRRPYTYKFKVDPKEKDVLDEKARLAGFENTAAYLRSILLR